jgi:transcriptional regulator with XRE-family HTH domain
MDISSEKFARAFGDALREFLDAREIKYAEAARRMGIGRAVLNTYLNDCKGKRAKARVEVLFSACSELGFTFDYNGYQIGTKSLAGHQPVSENPPSEQFSFDFDRQFYLTEGDGTVSVNFRREPGRVEFTVALRSAS